MISRQFQILLNVKDLTRKGFDQSSIAQKAGIPPFAVKRNQAQAKGFSMEQLKQAITDGVEFEEYVKQELGEDYEFVISTDETAFHIRMFFDIYRNGEKLSIPDERERQCYFDWENGKKKMHLVWNSMRVCRIRY